MTIDPVGIRLFHANLDQGYQDIDQFIAPKEERNFHIKNSISPYNRNYVSERIRIFEKIFPSEEKILQYRVQENFVNNLLEQKEKKLKLFKETKNKLLQELVESKIFYQTYILYNISVMLKQTFVNEIEKFTNIYSQFTIFCKKNNQTFKRFTIDNKQIFLQGKNDYNSEKDLPLLLRKLNRLPAKLFSNKISITFVVKSKRKFKK